MRAVRLRREKLRAAIRDSGEFDPTSGLGVDPARPRNPADERGRGQELAGPSVEDIEEAVLVGLE